VLKKIIFSGVLLTLVLTTTGLSCLPSTNQQSNVNKTKIIVWGVFDGNDVMDPIISQFQSVYKDIEVTYVKKDITEYEEKSVDALASQEGPDVWLIKNDWITRHYKKLVPMTDGLLSKDRNNTQNKSDLDLYTSTYVPVVSKDNIVDNKIYGFPLYVDTLALLYNLDIFQSTRKPLVDQRKMSVSDRTLVDPPATWEDVQAYTKLLTQKNGNDISRAGIALGTGANVDQATDILYALMLQNGTNMTASDHKSAAFNLSTSTQTGTPFYPGTNALDFYNSFANPAKDVYTWNNSLPNSVDAFKAGKVAMIIDYAFQANKIRQAVPTLNFDIGPLPQIKGAEQPVDYASYWTETVTKNSKSPDTAWQFVKFLSTTGVSRYSLATKLPSPLSADAFRQPKTTERTKYKSSTFQFQVHTAQSWNKGKYPQKVDTAFYTMIENVISFGQPLQTAMDTTASQVTKYLQVTN